MSEVGFFDRKVYIQANPFNTRVMTVQHQSLPTDSEALYNFESPLWSKYFHATRKHVRFPRNYKEVSALDELEHLAF
jgi:hypothetical protein